MVLQGRRSEGLCSCSVGSAAALGCTVVTLVPLELVGKSQLKKVLPSLALLRCFTECSLLKTFA